MAQQTHWHRLHGLLYTFVQHSKTIVLICSNWQAKQIFPEADADVTGLVVRLTLMLARVYVALNRTHRACNHLDDVSILHKQIAELVCITCTVIYEWVEKTKSEATNTQYQVLPTLINPPNKHTETTKNSIIICM